MIQRIRALWYPLSLTLISILLFYIGYYIFLISAVFLLMDTIGRNTDYERLLNIKEKKPQALHTLWEAFSHTRCSREVMMTIDPESRNYFFSMGYRWYHFLPDETFSKNSPFLKITTFYNLSRPDKI